ncbi:MAG: hypothetical protein K2O35_01960 [Clostridia bacterium]|nr:hypothetical protein [Clostridia bacterium]
MTKQILTTDEINAEIKKLSKSPYVKLARDTANKALRQKLYQLRSLDKKGRELAKQFGITLED